MYLSARPALSPASAAGFIKITLLDHPLSSQYQLEEIRRRVTQYNAQLSAMDDGSAQTG
jgi:hypothetical protein